MKIPSIKNVVKKLWILLFTQNPYKVKTFCEVTGSRIGEQIDLAEHRNFKYKAGSGELIYYSPNNKRKNNHIPDRSIGGEKRYLNTGLFRSPDRYVYSLSGGSIFSQIGLIYHKEKRTFIDESAKEWLLNLKESPYTHIINFPAKKKLSGITVSCLTNGSDGGFYHFIFESIIKIKLYEPILKYTNWILLNGPATEWKLKWIRRARIAESKIIWMTNTDHFDCEQLIFTNRLISDQQINHWCVNTLNEIFSISQTLPSGADPKIIWISRRGLERDIKWEKEILHHFPEFEIVDLSSMDVETTIQKLQQATHIIGPHGAGLSNVYLCKPKTKILEIYPLGKTYQPCYSRISEVCSLQYYCDVLNFEDKNHQDYGLGYAKRLLNEFIS
ncbi:glycosyltransferase family 61 protein [Pedobacter agri]|uniref:glycosyltransferase family 61 protein n=1 Tax=Pedobacter agri TaxID=454586 RepID=UPI00292FCC08|nr:glycosyltransferase family 61 protein [Pedobacter agri]